MRRQYHTESICIKIQNYLTRNIIQKFVSDTLTAIGIENTDIGETGVIALISADHHDKNDTCIALVISMHFPSRAK